MNDASQFVRFKPTMAITWEQLRPNRELKTQSELIGNILVIKISRPYFRTKLFILKKYANFRQSRTSFQSTIVSFKQL